jgi:hypothetical protein
MVHYANPHLCGLNKTSSLGDGYSINLTWYLAYPDNVNNKIAYHIYFAEDERYLIYEGIKFVVIDDSLSANIINLTPGQDYWFTVRPVEYDPDVVDFLSELPISHDNVRFYPTSLLREDISATDLLIPLMDVDGFPSSGLVKIGIELIEYSGVDTINNNLIVPPATPGDDATLVLQSNGKYYLPASTNVGQGSLANLALVGPARTETWIIRCVFVEMNNDGYPYPSTAIFETFNADPGNPTDGYGNFPTWKANGSVISDGVLSFSILETSTFAPGDYFIVQTLSLTNGFGGGRGFNNTPITLHTICGFDGYYTYNPLVSVMAIEEDNRWDNIYSCKSRFEYPHYPFTVLEGYHQVTQDYLSTDLSAADAANVTFPMYDYAGYHRTDPVLLLNGTCVGSYIGGQQGCIDGYGNVNMVRGMNLQDQQIQRLDFKLSIDGQPAVLIKRRQNGVTCNCYLASSEYPDDRCPFCYGTKFVFGFEQYFNPRRSDGRILVRTSPTAEKLTMYEAGMESEFQQDMWTLTVPTIKMRDVLVLFDQDNNEEFRYEVADVTRNKTILGLDGGQTMKTFRIRKTDPAYQIRVFRDTSDFPQTLNTSLGFSPGLPPHTHTIQSNEGILAVSQINQTTGVSQGHSHPIIAGVIMEVLGHTHQIII